MKAQAKVYKGIEFISVSDLPANQQLLLEHNPTLERIKILLDGKVIKNCIQFREYEQWYTTVYKKSVPPAEVTPMKEVFPLNISLHKA